VRGEVGRAGHYSEQRLCQCLHGKRGFADARATAEIAARELGIKPEAVFVASTGVIGEYLPMRRWQWYSHSSRPAVTIGLGTGGGAIMTTDRSPSLQLYKKRSEARRSPLQDRKGSGMIHPNMATMLCFIITDANISAPCFEKPSGSTEDSFNKYQWTAI